VPFSSESGFAQRSMLGEVPPDAVLINGNENPMGPCKEAAEAARKLVDGGGRYRFELAFKLAAVSAQLEGLKPENVTAYAGSSDPLHRIVMAFCSKEKGLVVANPGYEAGPATAQYLGAKVTPVPLLASTFAHDVKKMATADPNAGVIYICNPNNPTGTLTSKADIEWLIDNKPKGAIVLLDEAYIHISHQDPMPELVAKGKDVIILRTFSKLYGMAGLRAGLAFGRPDLLKKLQPLGSGMMPITGMAAATASLQVPTLVADRRKVIKDIRDDVFSFLSKKNIGFNPSDSNCFMLDTKQPAMKFMAAMAKEKIYVGRSWPVWPNHSRITIGTKAEMEKFKLAVAKVMA
jgi:histidinol-phosphate/aromatic aminotransferase/cobyric acid decarboxylase-like protein